MDMSFLDYVVTNWERISILMAEHVHVVAIAIVIASGIALVLAITTEPLLSVRRALLSFTGTLLTIPSFALFALMIPLFGLGFVPTVVALTTYAVFPILRNMVTGLDGVDDGVLDAANGLGMSGVARLWRVKIPLAWPIILNGMRVATIMVVATAAIGAAVNGPGLGVLIFRGLARIGGANALNEALSGVIGIVVVAAALDLLFVLLGRVTRLKGIHV
jgi:osmoprotectant transport system permease protein